MDKKPELAPLQTHTTGPWYAKPQNTLGWDAEKHLYYITPKQDGDCFDLDTITIAVRGQQNARVIAAAPELKSTVENLLSWARTYKRIHNTSEDGPLAHDIRCAEAILNKVING